MSSRDGVNPLRPYYIPPSIGVSVPPPPPLSSPDASLIAGTGASLGASAGAASLGAGSKAAATTAGRYASRARDMLSEMEYYNDYLGDPSHSAVRSYKAIVDHLVWRYSSVLMAQPFEVAKTLLQVRSSDWRPLYQPGGHSVPRQASGLGPDYKAPVYDRPSSPPANSDSDDDEVDYFAHSHPGSGGTIRDWERQRDRDRGRGRPTRHPGSAASLVPTASAPPSQQLQLLQPDSVVEVIGQLWAREGTFGVWKGSNASFLYHVLQSMLENWSRSVMSAVLNVPDIGIVDDIDRIVDIAVPYPWASLFVATTAAVVTGLVLAPLDLVRTRLLLTPSSYPKRRTVALLRSLPSYFCPTPLILPTILHSLIHPLISLATPLVLRTRLLVDHQLSPTTLSLAKYCATSAAIFVKLPLETVLRRCQAAVLTRDQDLPTIVPVGPYLGVVGTMSHIVLVEGTRGASASKSATPPAAPAAIQTRVGRQSRPDQLNRTSAYQHSPRLDTHESLLSETSDGADGPRVRGQGLPGLWRGWKVGLWGLVGLWGTSMLARGGEGEF